MVALRSLTEDVRTHKRYAVKKIARAFDSQVDARRILREVKLLKYLRHENLVRIERLLPSSSHNLCDLYLVFELMDTDLHQIIQSKQNLSEEHCRYFLYQVRGDKHCSFQHVGIVIDFIMLQMLRGLKYIHSANVVHRDLKPCKPG